MELTWFRMLGAGAALLFMAVVNKQSYVYDFEGTVLAVQGKGIRALAVTSQVNERTLQEPTAVNLGNKGPYPLSLCEGDCDNNDHCEGDLVCHDRDPGEDAPGCYLDSRRRSSPTDFCTTKDAITGISSSGGGGDDNESVGGGDGDDNGADGDDNGADGDDNGADGDDNSGGSSSGAMGSEKFGLKLFWQKGYFWQFERFERKWCLRCRSGCRSGIELRIIDCEQISPTDFRLIQYDSTGQEAQIKVSDRNLCLEADTSNNVVFLARCDSSDAKQRFIAQGGNFLDGKRFEIVPKTKRDWCVTQKHHPKWNEVIFIEPCDVAREAQTSYWNKYY